MELRLPRGIRNKTMLEQGEDHGTNTPRFSLLYLLVIIHFFPSLSDPCENRLTRGLHFTFKLLFENTLLKSSLLFYLPADSFAYVFNISCTAFIPWNVLIFNQEKLNT